MDEEKCSSLIAHVSSDYVSSSRQRGDRHRETRNECNGISIPNADRYLQLALPKAQKRLTNPTINDLAQKYDGTNPFHAPLDNYKASSPSRY